MKKIIYTYLILNLFILNVISQNTNAKYKIVTVPAGDMSLIPTPSDSSERIKYYLKIEKDSTFYTLKADYIEQGEIVVGINEDIVSKRKVFKGQDIAFEMVPDLSNPVRMTLFTYLSTGFIAFNYLLCDVNKKIKYKKFDFSDQSQNLIPLILCYVDDEQNQTERLLEKNLKDISTISKEDFQEKILKYIEKGLFIYHNQSDN